MRSFRTAQRLRSVIHSLRRTYPHHGSFRLKRGESIRKAVREGKVPQACAIYIVTALSRTRRIVYIGRAGTMKRDGTWRVQKLYGRLCAVQGGKPRSTFFRQYIQRERLKGLLFEWFVTFNGDIKVLPCLAEAQLLQAYFSKHGCLPELNASA
jgi:hypothetical protein